MVATRRTAVMLLTWMAMVSGADAQELDRTQEAYFRAVGDFFRVSSSELDILGDWRLPPDEIPVVLFIAERAGVAPEALVALRRSGESWTALGDRYGVGAPELHIPLPAQAGAGPLADVYESFRTLPANRWREIHLGSGDIVALVNVRLLSQTLGIPPADVLARAASTATFVQLYGVLIR